ncbi:MAG: ankyrin repeat domain-containing protein [Betaproteobacteria bacterium]|nr:ankyrin repeat domain-containing protein [Betaproteobacteria bacterium]
MADNSGRSIRTSRGSQQKQTGVDLQEYPAKTGQIELNCINYQISRLKLRPLEYPRRAKSKTGGCCSILLPGMAVAAGFALALTACEKVPPVPVATGPAQSRVDVRQAAAPAAQESPLARAAARGNLAKVRELLDAGARIDEHDNLGRTPLHLAAFSGYPKTSALLIARGAGLDAKDRVGMTPLHAAVLGGEIQEVELILDNKPDIRAATDTGLTALHLAAATGQDKLATLLVQRGADPQSKDRDGRTPLFYALKNQHPSTVAILQNY